MTRPLIPRQPSRAKAFPSAYGKAWRFSGSLPLQRKYHVRSVLGGQDDLEPRAVRRVLRDLRPDLSRVSAHQRQSDAAAPLLQVLGVEAWSIVSNREPGGIALPGHMDGDRSRTSIAESMV